MPHTKIAYLGLFDSDKATGSPRGERHLLALARSVVAGSAGNVRVELLSCGPAAECRPLCPGVVKRVLRWAGRPRTPWDASSWELPAALADASLVHLHDGFSRECEIGLLVAKQQRTPVCISEYGLIGHWLSIELGLHALADMVICHSASVAAPWRGVAPVEVVSGHVNPYWFGVASEWPRTIPVPPADRADESPPDVDYVTLGAQLSAIYRRLLARQQEAAA